MKFHSDAANGGIFAIYFYGLYCLLSSSCLIPAYGVCRGVDRLWFVVGRTSSGEGKMWKKNPTLLPEIFHKGPSFHRFEMEGPLCNRAPASGHGVCADVEIHP